VLLAAEAEAVARVTRQQRRPEIGVGVQGRSYTGDAGFREGMATVSFTLPWLNAKRYDSDFQRDRASVRASEHDAADHLLSIREEIHHLTVELDDGSVVNLPENGRFLDFTLNMGLPSWRNELKGIVIEKSIVVPSRQNIVHCTFRSLGDGQPVRLRVRPLINFRALEAPVADAPSSGYTLTIQGQRYEVSAGPDLPILRLAIEGAEGPTFTATRRNRRIRPRAGAGSIICTLT